MLDTCALVELLSGIDCFHTSRKHAQGVQCKGQNHQESCCKECGSSKGKFHTCSKCNKIKCNGGKCCQTNSKKCDHPCPKCKIIEPICKNNYKACCKICKNCSNCYLLVKQKPIEELVRSGDWIKYPCCTTRNLKISINLLSKLRNLTMHLTNEECLDLDASRFDSSDFPGVNNWNDLNTIISEVLKFLVRYLSYNTPPFLTIVEMDRINKDIKDIGKITDKEQLLRVYEEKILNFGIYEHLFEINKDLKQLDESMQRLNLENKRLTFHVKFIFGEDIDYDLDCELAEQIEKLLEARIKIVSNNRCELIANGLVEEPISNAEAIKLEFQIKATTLETNLSVYEKSKSEQSKKLWNEILECILEEIPNIAAAKRTYWKLGSIIIGVQLHKSSGVFWSKEERESIAKLLPVICSKLNKQYAECLFFSCQVIPIPIQDGHNYLKTLSFEIVFTETEEDIEAVTETLSMLDCVFPSGYLSARSML